MKTSILILSILFLAQSAQASVINCGIPKDEQGQIQADAPEYSIEIDAQNAVYLVSKSGNVESKVEMEKNFQGVDGASFSADSVTLSVMNGRMTLSDGSFYANCPAN